MKKIITTLLCAVGAQVALLVNMVLAPYAARKCQNWPVPPHLAAEVALTAACILLTVAAIVFCFKSALYIVEMDCRKHDC